MNIRFIFFIALRYLKERKRNKKIASSFLSIIGLTVGIMTLIAVLAVMNGFQRSFIEPIIEIVSYHIQVRSEDNSALNESTIEQIKELKNVNSVIPFFEIQTISDSQEATVIRGIPVDAVENDPGFVNTFNHLFDIPDRNHIEEKNSIVLGMLLARKLHVGIGDTIDIMGFTDSSYASLSPKSLDLNVTGIFKTGYQEIDLFWGFISLETAGNIVDNSSLPLSYGIKLFNRDRDIETNEKINNLLYGNFKAESWQDYNKAFFGALRTEKLIMMFLVGLIFVVVGFNIFYSLRRAVYERTEEIGTLKAYGASTASIKNIFMLEGFIIGFLGCFFGIILGLFISGNINEIFRFSETLINEHVFPFLKFLLHPIFGDIIFPEVSIFSSRIYYIDDVPAYVFFHEVFIVSAAALMTACSAALFASGYVSKIKPAKLMRYE
jgi:lipoprotein-releasing system permease protein